MIRKRLRHVDAQFKLESIWSPSVKVVKLRRMRERCLRMRCRVDQEFERMVMVTQAIKRVAHLMRYSLR